jgi:hypothetical protein
MTIRPLIVPNSPNRWNHPAGTAPATPSTVTPRQVIPLPEMPPHRLGDTIYGFGSVDDRGRVADLVAPQAMGWVPGTRLRINVHEGLLVIQAHPDGPLSITGRGHLRVPTPVRRWCGLVPGDRVLLAADPDRGRLVLHPPATLDRMIAQAHAVLRDGGAA